MTKPGIIYGNLITAAAGFCLASRHHFNASLFLKTMFGLGLVIASACVFNNYIDRDIDKKMARTQRRALVTHELSGAIALAYASILGIAGFLILGLLVDMTVFGLALFAFISYVALYGWAKRNTVHGTLVGSLPGAIPPVIGYTAVTDHIDKAAGILFLILVFWQMPHFYAIAMYQYKDYKAAGVPVLPVKSGMKAARRQIIYYIFLFMAACAALSVWGSTGYTFMAAAILLGGWWLWNGAYHLKSLSDERWGRRMFIYSLIANLGISLLIAVGALLP